jgi:hypothetical protein
MGAAAAERMERRGMTAHLSHAVALPCDKQNSTLCGVVTYSLCMDESLATDELPDCPKCRRKLANAPDQRPAGNDL